MLCYNFKDKIKTNIKQKNTYIYIYLFLNWKIFFLCVILPCFSFQLRNLKYEELEARLADLDPEMEREIDELRARYQAKRQPILEAINAKKNRQKFI